MHKRMLDGWQTSAPTPHPELGRVASLSFRQSGGCALSSDHRVACWWTSGFFDVLSMPPPGGHESGIWHDRAREAGPSAYEPVAVNVRDVVEIAAATDADCFRTDAGAVYLRREGRVTPVPAMRGAKQVACGFIACAIAPDGGVLCLDPEDERPVVARVAGLEGATQISVGFTQACARLSSGRAMCWQTVDEGTDPAGAAARWVGGDAAPTTGVVEVAAGKREACVLLEDATVHCFGLTSGVPPPPPAERPVRVL